MADIAASVLAKLRNKAKASGISYQQCLQLFVQEEFLRRLSKSEYEDTLILKGGLFIYIFRQFYLNLPKDIENAAKIDGCNYLQTYLKIVLPMGKSSLLVALILSAVWHWNDYYEPSIYATGSSMILLPQKTYMLTELVSNPPFELISQFVTGEGNPINTATLMAGTVMCLAPLILLFSVLQTRFMEGIERTGLVE